MGHAEIDNRTPFAFDPIFTANEARRPVVVLLSKATFSITNDTSLVIAEEQDPICYAGEFFSENGSYRYEPEASWLKPATDVVLIGSAWTQSSKATTVDIGFRMGPLTKSARVFGDRTWFKVLGCWKTTPPRAFEKMPLTYERAFGIDQRNPVGRGIVEEGSLLPNIEDLRHLITNSSDRPAPVGFGFTSPNWLPRAWFRGTYDDAWSKQRAPWLPEDFDRRYLNAASTGLIASGYLKGDEPLVAINVSKSGRINFNLPNVGAPRFNVIFANNKVSVDGHLDTVIINTDDNKVHLLWRNEVVLQNGPHDVLAIRIGGA